MKKPKWFKPALEVKGVSMGCACCPATSISLNLKTKLYNGFGGYSVWVNGKYFWSEDVKKEYNKAKTLQTIENQARKRPNKDWQVKLDLPLRSAVYQRHEKNKWILIESGLGFA